MPPTTRQNPWHRRLRRLIFFFGAGSAAWFLLSYMLDRMREARVRAAKERRERDLMKNHFNSLSSTLSFTLYALLPTLGPQLSAAYPVESTSQALQGLVTPDTGSTPDQSLVLPSEAHSGASTASASTQDQTLRVGQSWASEFGRADSVTSGELLDASMHGGEADETVSLTPLQCCASSLTKLIPTGIGFFGPVADYIAPAYRCLVFTLSAAERERTIGNAIIPAPAWPTTKQEQKRAVARPQASEQVTSILRDGTLLTVALAITRSLTTAYLVPLVYLLTTSQLSILARLRYLADVKAAVDANDSQQPSLTPRPTGTERSGTSGEERKRSTSWYGGLSISSLGLSEFVDASTPSVLSLPNPVNLLPTAISSRLPAIPFFSAALSRVDQPPNQSLSLRLEELEAEKAEAERIFLTYSWWILHEGWQAVGARIEASVDRVFGGLPLKRELAMRDWEDMIREVRASIETSTETGDIVLYDFAQHLLPPSPLPSTTSPEPCPLPSSTEHLHPYLVDLLAQSAEHLESPDAKYLIDKGVSAMVASLVSHMDGELYAERSGYDEGDGEGGRGGGTRRLVDCLPALDRWGKDVWENIPDNGVEAVLAVKEFENFAALIFGDWAPR